ncbi:hypothetical protein AB7M56_006920 [Bradyrhizobium elkanii]|jgi:hypothetical protein|nr:hypothetical protein [Bradyrhizobium elkanii]
MKAHLGSTDRNLVHLKVIRGSERRRFILISQFLFGQLPKLFVAALRPSSLFPELMGVHSYFFFCRFCHLSPPSGSRLGLASHSRHDRWADDVRDL